jgi:hypothetical protein
VGDNSRAGRIRYVLIPSDSKETNRLITGVETTFEEVTVDSPSFESKNALGTRWAMLRQCCRSRDSVTPRRLALTKPLRIPAELPIPRATASIESP